MIHAYNKEYLPDAMENLGEAFDYAVNAQGLTLNQFASLFINSSTSASFENGNPKYLSGMSGTELALTVLTQNGLTPKKAAPLPITKNHQNTGPAGFLPFISGIPENLLKRF